MINIEIWGERLNATLNNIDSLLAQINDGSAQNLPRKNTIKYLLQELHDFGKSHSSYFFEAFTGKTISGEAVSGEVAKLEEDKEYSNATVLNWITTQISNDLSIILRAWDQRRDDRGYRAILNKADIFAQLALCPAIECGFIPEETTVLSYFQKSYSVRLMPYAKVALVGIPFSVLTVNRDFLAIPHEVAHYVFRHGTRPDIDEETNQPVYNPGNQSIASFLKWNLRNNNQYLKNWTEELFADMYGCVIAGPVIALDFQDLQMDDPLEEFADATIDYEDPPPMLRPDTYSKVLALSRDTERPRLAELLHHRWKLYREQLWENYLECHPDKFQTLPSQNNPSLIVPRNSSSRSNDIRNGGVRTPNEINSTNSDNTIPVDNIREDSINLSESLFDAVITEMWDEFISDVWDKVNTSGSKCHNLLHLSGDIADPNSKAILSTLLANETVQDFPGQTKEIRDESLLKLDEKLTELYKHFGKALDGLIANETVKDAIPRGSATNNEERDNRWKAWRERWEKRNQLRTPVQNNNGKLQSERRSYTEAELTSSQRPEKEWGWVELAYAKGWVTRGPEPNPTGT